MVRWLARKVKWIFTRGLPYLVGVSCFGGVASLALCINPITPGMAAGIAALAMFGFFCIAMGIIYFTNL